MPDDRSSPVIEKEMRAGPRSLANSHRLVYLIPKKCHICDCLLCAQLRCAIQWAFCRKKKRRRRRREAEEIMVIPFVWTECYCGHSGCAVTDNNVFNSAVCCGFYGHSVCTIWCVGLTRCARNGSHLKYSFTQHSTNTHEHTTARPEDRDREEYCYYYLSTYGHSFQTE